MRYTEIMELAGVKRFRNMTASNIIKYMKQNFGQGRVELLGKGSAGVAVKIGNVVYKFWMVDSAYTDFVNYCLQHQNNPFLPKFLSNIKKTPAFFIRHADAPDYVNYIKMEELGSNMNIDALDYEFKFNLPEEITANRKQYGDPSSITMEEVAERIKYMKESDNPLQDFVDGFSNKEITYQVDQMSKELRLMVQTLCDIRNLGHEIDLHEDNIMWRGNQMVILDPIYSYGDHDINSNFKEFDKAFKTEQGGKPAVQSNYAKHNPSHHPEAHVDDDEDEDDDDFDGDEFGDDEERDEDY